MKNRKTHFLLVILSLALGIQLIGFSSPAKGIMVNGFADYTAISETTHDVLPHIKPIISVYFQDYFSEIVEEIFESQNHNCRKKPSFYKQFTGYINCTIQKTIQSIRCRNVFFTFQKPIKSFYLLYEDFRI